MAMQKLEIYQSLWAMERRQPGQEERPVEVSFEMIAAAGFDGVCLDPACSEIDHFLALKSLFEKYDLKCMVNAFPYTVAELTPLLTMARQLDASLVNVIGGVMPLTVAEGAHVIRRWIADGEREGIPLLFETHRDSTLNDLFYTLQMLDAVPEMRLCADLSHFVLDREMRLPLSEADRSYMHRILGRSDCFQGRIASREQIQVQIEFPQHGEWVEQFKMWWQDGLGMWRQRNEEEASVIFLCELGPPPYAITDAQGAELSDRWQEALTIKKWVEKIWQAPPTVEQ
jgi:hypothetical protein